MNHVISGELAILARMCHGRRLFSDEQELLGGKLTRLADQVHAIESGGSGPEDSPRLARPMELPPGIAGVAVSAAEEMTRHFVRGLASLPAEGQAQHCQVAMLAVVQSILHSLPDLALMPAISALTEVANAELRRQYNGKRLQAPERVQ